MGSRSCGTEDSLSRLRYMHVCKSAGFETLMFRTGLHVTDASFRQARCVHLFSLPSLPPNALPLPVCFPYPHPYPRPLLIPSPPAPGPPFSSPLYLPLPPPLTLLSMYPSLSPTCPFLDPASVPAPPVTLTSPYLLLHIPRPGHPLMPAAARAQGEGLAAPTKLQT